MGIVIDNPEVERNIRALAAATGEPIIEAVNRAALAQLEQTKSRRLSPERMAAIRELLARVDALPILDHRTPDEIIGYDEHGLPS